MKSYIEECSGLASRKQRVPLLRIGMEVEANWEQTRNNNLKNLETQGKSVTHSPAVGAIILVGRYSRKY